MLCSLNLQPRPPNLCVYVVCIFIEISLSSRSLQIIFFYMPPLLALFFFTRGNILTLISHSRQALDSKRSVGGLLSLLHVKVMSSHRTQPIPFPSPVWPCHCPFATTMPSKGRRTIPPPTPALLFQNFYFHLFIFLFHRYLESPQLPRTPPTLTTHSYIISPCKGGRKRL